MKTFLLMPKREIAKRAIAGLVLASAVFLQSTAVATPFAVSLATALSYAVLADSGITVAGAVNSTTISGNIGTFPTTAITGLPNVILNGSITKPMPSRRQPKMIWPRRIPMPPVAVRTSLTRVPQWFNRESSVSPTTRAA